MPRAFLFLVLLFASCANIMAPTGGNKDVTPPELLSVSPQDSLLNTRVKKIELRFDEYVTLNNPNSEITIAPLLSVPLDITSKLKRVTVKIPDTLLQENTTYRISFNNAIRDLHEGNAITGLNYIFSTGAYFDSLTLSGKVIDAFTNQDDSAAVVVLYDARISDSSIVRTKPSYVTRTDAFGNFKFEGLPARAFRIYALRDENGNYIFDGGNEKVAFADSIVSPEDTTFKPISLRLFKEENLNDTSKVSKEQAFSKRDKLSRAGTNESIAGASLDAATFYYLTDLDTSNISSRTKNINTPVSITFSRAVTSFNANRIYLSYDSSNINVEVPFSVFHDSASNKILKLQSAWKPDAVYTLRLLKGFAIDSTGGDAFPSKNIFRTKRDEDYARLDIHLPTAYGKGEHLLLVLHDADTFYHQPVRDTMLKFMRIEPGKYTLRIIHDRNRDSVWTTGDLFTRRQPEEVIPYPQIITLKPGWENIIDFDPEEGEKKKNKTFNDRQGAR